MTNQTPADHVLSAARTVTNLAEHFSRIKQRGIELIDTFEASERGYFTPTEDEQTRHLLVSYWQSRNALIELVNSYRAVEQFDDGDRDGAFLTAYAGALLLVDAARFLRDYARSRPVVRGKLNEAEPNFGIPAGMYDRIQKSLTRPTHAWHLYHAAKLFAEQTEQFRVTAEENLVLGGPLKIINRLEARLDVSFKTYAVARTRERARSLRNKVTKNIFGRSMYGLQKSVSGLMAEKYVVRGHKPGLPPNIFEDIRSRIQPGDVFVVRKLHAITNYFLPGYWPHAALYTGTLDDLKQMNLHAHENVQPMWDQIEQLDDQPHRALEALADGVHVRSLSRALASDAVTVLRPRLSTELIAEALARGFFHEGKAYDFDGDFTRSDRMVCTEVIYRTYEGLGEMKFELTKRAGRMTLAAEDLLRMSLNGQGFDTVAIYSPEHSPEVMTGEQAADVLRQTT